MVTTSAALVAVADAILARVDQLSTAEISKKGRKYRFVNNTFQRIREEDKHLVIYPEDLDEQLSVILAYSILASVSPTIFSQFGDLCLSIVGVARLLELNGWYEEENSLVVNYKVLKFAYDADTRATALLYAENVTPTHLLHGYNLLYCSKLNFLHTDHHIGTKLEGHYMRQYVLEYFGEEALELPEVLVALKSFVHWANIKGLLHKLEVPNVDVDAETIAKFDAFPAPPEELLVNVYDRYPSGTSKYSLIRKAIDILADSKYARLVPYPHGPEFDLLWLFELCHNIETDPIRYHLRSVAKRLSKSPANLAELSQMHNDQIQSLLSLVSLVINTIGDTGGDFLLQNSKIPKFSDELINTYSRYHQLLVEANNNIEDYEMKGWDEDDIVSRLYDANTPNIYDEVMKMRERYSDDYE